MRLPESFKGLLNTYQYKLVIIDAITDGEPCFHLPTTVKVTEIFQNTLCQISLDRASRNSLHGPTIVNDDCLL